MAKVEKSKITADDIKYGDRRDTKTCPVARGLCRRYADVEVANEQIGLRRKKENKDEWIKFENSWALHKWIQEHDAMEKVEPIEVGLDFDDGVAFIVEEHLDNGPKL